MLLLTVMCLWKKKNLHALSPQKKIFLKHFFYIVSKSKTPFSYWWNQRLNHIVVSGFGASERLITDIL